MGNLATRALIDAVDRNDRVVGVIDRAELPRRPANFRVAHAFVLNRGGSLLLQHIAPNERHGGLWGSSVAGYVLAGETYYDACVRKLRAELGIQVPPSLIGKTSMSDLGAIKFLSLFVVSHDGPFTLDPTQADTAQFFNLRDLQQALRRTPGAYTDTLKVAFQLYTSRTP